jgi:hypothetical protein
MHADLFPLFRPVQANGRVRAHRYADRPPSPAPQFERDAEMVRSDLLTLKRILET